MSQQPSRPEEPPVEVVGAEAGDEERLVESVEQPAKVMRIGSMIKQLLEEVRQAPLDDASRTRLREIYETSVRELGEGLSPDLRDELARLALPFLETATPRDRKSTRLNSSHSQISYA